MALQSQRDCVLPPSNRVREATLGQRPCDLQPQRGWVPSAPSGHNPVGVGRHHPLLPGVRAASYPGLWDGIPLGFSSGISERHWGYALLVPPTVIAELAFFASLKEAPQHEIANVALESVASSQALQLRSSSSSILSSPARARAGWCGPSSIRPRFRSYGCHFVPAVRWWS